MADKASVRGLTLALGATGIVVAAFLSTSPIPQDPAYHAFASLAPATLLFALHRKKSATLQESPG